MRDDLKGGWEKYEDVQKRELELTEREFKLKQFQQQHQYFQEQMTRYLDEHSGVDYSTVVQCDNEKARGYRKAKASLKALEGTAKAINVYEEYQSFFKSQLSGIRVFSQC